MGFGLALDSARIDTVIPIRDLSTREILYGDRVTSYRWEILSHSAGNDQLVGYLDGVVEGGASLSWQAAAAVKGGGNVKVTDLDAPQPGFMSIRQVPLAAARIRPVLVIDGLPEIPLGVYLIAGAPEAWSETGRVLDLELLDRATVLDQDEIAESFTVDTATPILSAVGAVIASAGESIVVDATVTTVLSSPKVWEAGTTKLQIVNDLLEALNYSSLWVDPVGAFQATPYVLPVERSLAYELLNGIDRELVDGDESIYSQDWSRDRDQFRVPNKVIAVQAGNGTTPALVGEATNLDPESPFSYPSRGRWITKTLTGIDTPSGTDSEIIAFLQSKARQSLIASSAVQATVTVKHLPVPIRVSNVMRFANVPAEIDARHVVTSIKLDANPLGLMQTELQEVIDL